MSKTVADLMTPNPITVQPQTPLREAIKLLVERDISGLPVVDETGKAVGVLSEADLMWQESGAETPPYVMFLDSVIYLKNPTQYEKELHKALGQTVGEVMTENPVTVSPNCSLPEAAKILHDKKIRRLIVVDENDRPTGIVTQRDILRSMVED
ncbi:CBS domain-containing protein [Oscillatoria sp. FACHB-1406]|uniref:CBS domain-containing protein n=1 Tax=Oscillatoria sp. FACHB-1406 TaxID=2692846 RepID=UPI0016840147|nr:CBS domain-containing protein [Oscillatoria sp. FACHB-1406]MBD2580385.1 CBS domain-containing protein [Oscillatoria sp. FACHB-1406]